MDWFDLIELVVELLFDVVVPVTAEILADMERQKRPQALGFPWLRLLVFGALAGAASALVWPHRFIREKPIVPGASLLLAPLIAARVMGWVGDRVRAQDITPTALASARGGALFAFGMAAVRLLMISWR
jgi:hypothetical protein